MGSRAAVATAVLESAIDLSSLAAKYCSQPGEFEKFRAWAREAMYKVADGQAERDVVDAGLDAATPETMQAAGEALQVFWDGFGSQLGRIPDSLLDIAGEGYRAR